MADDLRAIPMPKIRPSRGAGPVRFEWSDVLAMSELGLFGENDRVELIEGEMVVMPEEAPIHAMALQILQRWLLVNMSADCELYIRGSLKVSGVTTYLIPDLCVLPLNFAAPDRTVALARLLIEVSNTTLKFDINKKRTHYARAGAKDYWVIDTNAQSIIVHREPSGESFRSVQTYVAGQLVAPLCATSAGFDPAMLPNPADYADA